MNKNLSTLLQRALTNAQDDQQEFLPDEGAELNLLIDILNNSKIETVSDLIKLICK